MNQIKHLQDQAARAERLARNALDTLTIERLSAFAEECRQQIRLLTGGQTLIGEESVAG